VGEWYSLVSETAKLAIEITTTTDTAITKAGSSLAVTASAEHIPSTCIVIGLSLLKVL
jgi:hypothetical protein